MIHWIRLVVVFFEEIKDAEAEHFKSNAGVTMIVKPIEDFYTQTKRQEEIVSEEKTPGRTSQQLTAQWLFYLRVFPAR